MSENSTQDNEFSSMQEALRRLSMQKEDLEIAYSTAVEHGDAVEEQLTQVNTELSHEVQERRRAELTLRELVATITRQKEDLEIALMTAIEHGDAIEEQLQEVNKELHLHLGARKEIEGRLQTMVANLSRQKEDLELLVDTVASHGDQINDQMHQHLTSIELLARADSLTGLWNRRTFDETLEKEWQRSLRKHTPLALLVIDIDHFKRYNDSFGHHAGDECLIEVAKVLSSMARRGTDLVARYGGEEFVILLPDCDVIEAGAIADETRERVSRLAINNPESSTGHITLSIGVAACLPGQGDRTVQLFELADSSLYQAKHEGRNRVCMAATSGADQ